MKNEKEMQSLLIQIQQYQQQAQMMAMQKQQLEIQNIELTSAEEAVKASKSDEVFRAVGPILVKSNKTDVQKYITETKEKIDLRLKAVEKQEKRLGEKMKELGEKLKPFVPELSG